MKNHRIAAGGIVVKDDKILLVKYYSDNSGSYFAAPGGALLDNENIEQAIKREVKEETGITVKPVSVIMIEDLDCLHFKMCKIWMSCEYISGEIQSTREAKAEGIIETGWYTENDIFDQVVFPSIIRETKWDILSNIKNTVNIPATIKTSF
jgi:ADP-ribose pyrophosphatase YjhB (NUDIX family)